MMNALGGKFIMCTQFDKKQILIQSFHDIPEQKQLIKNLIQLHRKMQDAYREAIDTMLIDYPKAQNNLILDYIIMSSPRKCTGIR